MKKKIFIALVFTGIVILFFIFMFTLEKKQSPFTPQALPTPTPFQSVQQTRHPDTLPEDILNAEREFLQQTPILQKLPARSAFFGIEYINEQHLIIHAKIADKERAYEEAQEWFVEHKIDISTIIVEYR